MLNLKYIFKKFKFKIKNYYSLLFVILITIIIWQILLFPFFLFIKENFKKNFFIKEVIILKNKIHKNDFDLNTYYGENVNVNNFNFFGDLNYRIIVFLEEYRPFILERNNKISNLKFIGEQKDSRPHVIIKENNNYNIIFTNAFSNKKEISLHLYDEKFNFINEKWKKNYLFDNHQWLKVYNNKLYVPGSSYENYPVKFQKIVQFSNLKNCFGKYRQDTVEIVNLLNGHHIQTISIFDKIFSNKYFDNNSFFVNCLDPLHLNDIEIIDSSNKANFFTDGKIGDVLISSRELHSLFLFDRDTHEIKWSFSNITTLQNSPIITETGKILLLDNDSKNVSNGKSRVVYIDINSKKIIKEIAAKEGEYFESIFRGKLQILNNKIFISEQLRGRLLYVECEDVNEGLNCSEIKLLIDFKRPFYLSNVEEIF